MMLARLLAFVALLFTAADAGIRCPKSNDVCTDSLGGWLYGCCCGGHCWVVTLFHTWNCHNYCKGRRSIADLSSEDLEEMGHEQEAQLQAFVDAQQNEEGDRMETDQEFERMAAFVEGHNAAFIASQTNWLIAVPVVAVLAVAGAVAGYKCKKTTVGTEYESIAPARLA